LLLRSVKKVVGVFVRFSLRRFTACSAVAHFLAAVGNEQSYGAQCLVQSSYGGALGCQ
jgi:hypothetical protein